MQVSRGDMATKRNRTARIVVGDESWQLQTQTLRIDVAPGVVHTVHFESLRDADAQDLFDAMFDNGSFEYRYVPRADLNSGEWPVPASIRSTTARRFEDLAAFEHCVAANPAGPD